MKLSAVLLSFISLTALQAQPTQQYSHGEPTDAEQLMLEYINQARANPSAEGQRLIASTDPSVQSAIQFFQVNTDVVLDAFDAMQAVPPLAFQPQLMQASRVHSRAMIDGDEQKHQLPGEADIRDRTVNAGYTDLASLRENIYAYVETPWQGHAGFQIDWTFVTAETPDGIQVPAGHRIAIMDETNPESPFTEIGISIVADDNAAGTTVTGPFVVTQDFAQPLNPTFYVLGVVYEDTDNDGFYSEGEGLAGVTIMPDQGDWFAVTSSSGGYAIPLESVSGSVTLTASGGSLGSDMTDSFTFSEENIKVDFVPTTGSTPTKDPAVDFGSDSIAINNYVLTTWFAGFFDLSQNGAPLGWLYHDQHGSIFYIGDENGMWFYSESLEWTYTERSLYPNMFINNIGWVFYYEQDSTQRVFFDYDRGMNFFNDPTVDNQIIYF